MTTTTDQQPVHASKIALIFGWILSVLPCLLFFMSAYMKLSKNPQAIEGFAKAGYPDGMAVKLGAVELACTLLYLIPQTSVLGAILLTGYLGGAINHHVRLGEAVYTQSIMGIVLWLGLFLRDRRIRALIPLRS